MADAHHVIAIDGPSASGKGTLSRGLADALGFAHLDTGALYRAVGLIVLQAGHDPENTAQAEAACEALKQSLRHDTSRLHNPDLRRDETGVAASKVAAMPSIREALKEIQQDFAQTPPNNAKGAVLDGRDIGTVICPDAPLKLFITANQAVRAERRMKELQSKGIHATYEAVLKDMRARDARDSEREADPMMAADDALVIDSSDLTADQILKLALEHAHRVFGNAT